MTFYDKNADLQSKSFDVSKKYGVISVWKFINNEDFIIVGAKKIMYNLSYIPFTAQSKPETLVERKDWK